MSNPFPEVVESGVIVAAPRPRAGRPTREQAERRHEELLDRALEIFLEKGFEQATIEAIAASVGMTKRTVYRRYDDKKALFRAAVQRAVDGWRVPIEALRAVETDDLEETLIAIARIRLESMIQPVGMKLQRIVTTESYRFPEFHRLAYEQGTMPALDYLADLFERCAARKSAIIADQPEMLAVAFLSMVLGGLTHTILLGITMDERTREERIRFYVRLFLNGARIR